MKAIFSNLSFWHFLYRAMPDSVLCPSYLISYVLRLLSESPFSPWPALTRVPSVCNILMVQLHQHSWWHARRWTISQQNCWKQQSKHNVATFSFSPFPGAHFHHTLAFHNSTETGAVKSPTDVHVSEPNSASRSLHHSALDRFLTRFIPFSSQCTFSLAWPRWHQIPGFRPASLACSVSFASSSFLSWLNAGASQGFFLWPLLSLIFKSLFPLNPVLRL